MSNSKTINKFIVKNKKTPTEVGDKKELQEDMLVRYIIRVGNHSYIELDNYSSLELAVLALETIGFDFIIYKAKNMEFKNHPVNPPLECGIKVLEKKYMPIYDEK